jgi:NADH-quinone oxidoreductase subunit N
MSRDLSFLLPELVLMITVALMLIGEMIRRPVWVLVLGLAGLTLATGLALPLLDANTEVFGGTYRIGLLAVWSKLILLPATALSLLLARAELAGRPREGSVYSLMVLVAIGALMLSGAGDLMLLVLGIVLTGLGSFALVAYPADDPATEASMKFLVFGSVAGAVMTYGLTFWYAGVGSTLFSALAGIGSAPLLGAAGLIAVLIGLGYKAALVPFHFWAPDAYDGAPVSVAAFMSVVTKVAAIFALAQALRDLPVQTGWQWAIAALAVLSMTYGYLTALVQSNLVRLVAYSSVAQSGYFLLGVIAVGASTLALKSLIVFGAAYAAMNIGAFAIILLAGRDLETIKGLGRRAPVLGAAMVVFLLSLAGIPPLFGFFGKALLFGAALDTGFLWLVVIAIVNSVLALAVYLRVVVAIYAPVDWAGQAPANRAAATAVWTVTLVITLSMGILSRALIG